MRFLERIRGKAGPEGDVPLDTTVASSREGGGVPNPAAPDQASTTGTTPSEGYVGRVGGDDVGAFEESGAERRAQERPRSRRGAHAADRRGPGQEAPHE